MNKEFNGFDEMVEALEENEDMVECKECFDLVPKVDCERAEVGYICPTCKGLRTAPAQARFVDPYDSYTQDFPEITEYDPGSMVEYEKEPGLGDALSDLIRDEYEAIDGYEAADETIQHADIDEDEKDEILDTLDHIKEEEEEHIDELKELCPECEPEKEDTQENLTESAGEPKIYYIYADDGYIDDLGYMEAMDINEVIREAEIRYSDRFHPEDLYVEEAEPESLVDLVPSDFIIPPKHFKFNEALTEAEPEKLEEAADDEVVDEEAEVEEIPEEDIPEEDIPEEEVEDSEENENEEVSDLDSAYETALEIANESGVGQVFGYARKETEEFVAIEPFEVDDPEAVEDDLMAVYDDVAYAYVAYPEKSLEESLFEDVQLNEGPGNFFKSLGQKMGNAAKHRSNKASGKVIDKFFNEGYILVFEGPKDGMPAENKEEYETADQALTAGLQLSKEYPKYKVWVFAKPIDTSDLTPREKNLANVKNGLGATIACFRNGTVLQKKDKELVDALKKIEIDKQDLKKTIGKTAGENKSDPRDFAGEEDTKDKSETEGDEDPKDAAKKMLGEKKAVDGYTPESYKKYEAAYAKILAWIEEYPKPAALTQERIDNLKNEAEAKLKEVKVADPDLSDDETGDSTETTDIKIDDETGDATNGTEETGETVEKPADETPGEETAETTGEVKLSEVSEEQLKKLFTAVTGQGVGDNNKWQKVLKRMRAKLQELGESLDPSDYKPEDFIEEELQSEADAVKSLKDTAASLKATANSMQNMTSAMREEYHKYANPAELKVMEDLEAIVDAAKNDVLSSMRDWGIDIRESDAQGWMSGNNEYSYQFMLDYEGIDEDEEEDIQDQLQNLVENAILSQYTLPPELSKISISVALPDRDIAYEDEDGEELQDVKRASLFVDVTFARNLF